MDDGGVDKGTSKVIIVDVEVVIQITHLHYNKEIVSLISVILSKVIA